MGPTIIATTEDSKYAYVGFHLSDTIAKVRLADLAGAVHQASTVIGKQFRVTIVDYDR
jgi:hypothetical protein